MDRQHVTVDEKLLAQVLMPYRDHCKYLKSACVSSPGIVQGAPAMISAEGRFGIAGSWYIDDTGHFNAIEFNICYNQLAYVMLAKAIQDKTFAPLSHWTVAGFMRYQLSNYLIARFSSKFRQPMKSADFSGQVVVRTASRRRNCLMLKTVVQFEGAGGTSDGEVTLAILDPPEKESALVQAYRPR